MRFGAMNFPVRPVLEEVRKISHLGFDYLELAMDPPCAHYSDLDRMAGDLIRALESDNLGLVCHLPTFVYTADLTPGIRKVSLDEMICSLETAARLKAEKVVLHPSIISGLGAFVMEETIRYADESLSAITSRAVEMGLTLCLENMFPRYGILYDPEQFETVFNQFPDLLMTLDTGHAHIGDPEGNRLFDFMAHFGDRIGHIHISDNQGQRDEHLGVGRGTIDFERFSRELKALGYNQTITLEIFSQDTEDLIESRERIIDLLDQQG